MKDSEITSKLNLEISKDEEKDILLDNNKGSKNSYDNESLSEAFLYEELQTNNKKSKCNILKFPFIFYFFVIIIISTISFILFYIIFYTKNKPNFKIVDLPWIEVDLNDREYQYYIFNNNLQILLIHDAGFDMDGGAIVIENGYLDDPLNEGIASLATNLISQISFNDSNNISNLIDYFGNYKFDTDEYYTNFRFDILI